MINFRFVCSKNDKKNIFLSKIVPKSSYIKNSKEHQKKYFLNLIHAL